MIIVICLVISCQVNNMCLIRNLTDDMYYGKVGTHEVYLKISENYAYIDMIISDKHPRIHIAEIIKIDTISNVMWTGQMFVLKKENSYFFVNTIVKKDSILFHTPIKVTLNQEQYSKLNKRKNEAFFYNELAEIKKTHHIDYQNLNKKIQEHKLFEKIETLEFNEFKTEFGKFKNDILQ